MLRTVFIPQSDFNVVQEEGDITQFYLSNLPDRRYLSCHAAYVGGGYGNVVLLDLLATSNVITTENVQYASDMMLNAQLFKISENCELKVIAVEGYTVFTVPSPAVSCLGIYLGYKD